jgi:hypothetical protein
MDKENAVTEWTDLIQTAISKAEPTGDATNVKDSPKLTGD